MSQELIDLYNTEIRQEKFAALVATRVVEIIDGHAQPINFEVDPVTSALTPMHQTIKFADTIARSVVHYMATKGE